MGFSSEVSLVLFEDGNSVNNSAVPDKFIIYVSCLTLETVESWAHTVKDWHCGWQMTISRRLTSPVQDTWQCK